jgi:hypothetical protein
VNADQVADPIIEDDHVFGPNLPALTLGLRSTLRLPAGFELHVRGEYMGGHYIYDRVGNHLARRGVYPACDDAYALLEAGANGQLNAWQRVWCVVDDVPRDIGPIYPADFFRLRDVTVRVPLPESVIGWSGSVSLSARNAWTWTNDGFRLFDPEMAGRDGMHAKVRYIDAHLPPPGSFVLSITLGPR